MPLVNGMSPVLEGIWVVGSQGMEEMVAEKGGCFGEMRKFRGNLGEFDSFKRE